MYMFTHIQYIHRIYILFISSVSFVCACVYAKAIFVHFYNISPSPSMYTLFA